MLAGQRFERRCMPFDLFLPSGIHLQVVEIPAQLCSGLVRENGRFFEQLRGWGECRVGFANRTQGGRGLRQ